MADQTTQESKEK